MRAALSELYILTAIPFVLWVLLGAPHGLHYIFPGAANLVQKGIIFSIRTRVRKFIDFVKSDEAIRQCSLELSLAYLAYLCSDEVDRESFLCLSRCLYVG